MSLPDDVRRAVEARDQAALRALLAGLSERDRAALAPFAREHMANVSTRGIDGIDQLPAMLLLAFASLPVSDLRRLGWRTNHLPAGLHEVLRRRSTERLGPIVDFLLDTPGGRVAWRSIRPLVRDGVVPPPESPAYILAMIDGTGYKSVDEVRAADPALLDTEIWRLFDVEGGGDTSLASHEKYLGDRWGHVLRELAAGDPVARGRLLDASLAALGRDFSQFRAGWFSRFHESLGPSVDERAERVEGYLGLLRSRVGPTVSFAIAALAMVDRSGRLPAQALLDHVGPVLADAPAGTARTALGLVRRAGVNAPGQASRAALVAVEGLAHASPEVQGRAIELIGLLVDGPDPQLATAIETRLAGVATSRRPAGQALIERLSDGRIMGSVRPGEGPGSVVATLVEAQAAERPSPTDPERALTPIESLDELVHVAVSVIETGEPVDDLERVLAAVARLGAERTPAFNRLTGPIARRARTILGRRDSTPLAGIDPRADVASVLLAWAAGELVEPGWVHPEVDPGAGAFLSARAREIAERAAAAERWLTVAAPTHRGGWIEPARLVERLTPGASPTTRDLVAALLRLAPDGRAGALSAAAPLATEAGAVVRYALGGHEPVGPTAAWWAAAARVRAPGADDEAVERRHPLRGRAARFRLVQSSSKGDPWGLRLEVEPPLPKEPDADLPTMLMLRDPSIFSWTGRSEPAMYRWMATIQPGDREAWAATGALLLARNVDWWSAEWGNRAFLEPFLDPVTTIGPSGRLLLGVALGAKEAGERGLATDICGLAIADGRLTASDLAEGLAAAAAAGAGRPTRWATALADVAATSPAHATAVSRAVGAALSAVADRPPASLVPLLRLLDELLAASANVESSAGAEALERLAGAGGHAGRLARSILGRLAARG